MARICTEQIRLRLYNGWTAVFNQYVPRKADGTRDGRHLPRASTRVLHVHADGHRRYYKNNVLQAERYV